MEISAAEISSEEVSAGELFLFINSPDKLPFSSVLFKKNVFILDVREQEEFTYTHIDGSLLVPMMELEGRMDEVKEGMNNADVTVVVCRSGCRSAMVTSFLIGEGFTQVFNLAGGINQMAIFDSNLNAY
ncbi:MAG TPA: rhodanese-like domain-containing protein [Oligoflexia bacterium]|nr:rhodanese-like domain-containing protein [Oligoflexia bacterium]HMP47234.1 rhodanese-like domain-containing protein [Oligoflexia bacterium]